MTPQRQGSTHVDVDRENVTPKQMIRLQRLGRELRLTDQILSSDLDAVSIVDGGPAPAWTSSDGEHVSFNLAKMPMPVHKIDVAVWLGTNAHELGHVLFSPRSQSVLMRQVMESDRIFMAGIAKLHNIVEDQRQERLILARFAPWRDYLVAALGHHLVSDDQSAWLLMAGRTWLSSSIREAARERFVTARGERIANRVTELVGDYQRLSDPGEVEYQEAWSILAELHALFEDDMPKMPSACVVMEGGEPDTDVDTESASAPATADQADAPSEDDGESSDVGDDESNDDREANPGKGQSKATSESKSSSAEGQPDKGSSKQGGTDRGQATKAPSNKSVSEELLDEAERNMESDDDVKADIEAVLDALDYGHGTDDAEGDSTQGQFHEVSDAARRLHYTVSDALLDLKDQSEPGWVKRTDSGRLNVRRLLVGRVADPDVDMPVDPDTLFDRYEPGQMDASELEIVLLLDVSGSMNHKLFELGEATWAIRQAVDDIEGACTVIAWESGPHTVLAHPGDRPDDRMFVPDSMGGTDPTGALREAYRLLSESQARNRLMIVMTDGAWSYPQKSEAVIDAMNAEGIATVLAFLDTSYYYSGKPETVKVEAHSCRFAEQIDNPAALAVLFRQIAAAQIGSWL